jgi:short-subunit dehydrogenase
VKIFTPLMLAQNTEYHIVNTASGAGLIVGNGSAPYAVTKHAVVALSECMYFSLQQKNAAAKVSVLCPGLVRTNISNVERNRPSDCENDAVPLTREMEAGRAAFKTAIEAAMEPAQVAEIVFDAIGKEQFYILKYPEWTEVIRLRTERLLSMENPENPVPTILRLIQHQS